MRILPLKTKIKHPSAAPACYHTFKLKVTFCVREVRMRRVGIVALARRLLVALWRYLEAGELPEGAELKAAG
jgi:hypothetical protein